MHKTVIHYKTRTRKMFSEVQSQQVLPLLACGPESCLGAMWPLLPCGHPVWTLLEVVQNTVMSAEISHSEVPMRNKVYALPTWFFKNELAPYPPRVFSRRRSSLHASAGRCSIGGNGVSAADGDVTGRSARHSGDVRVN